jgi:NAD(P)-dependent dehydrogenase (short-subunit alcohol dehydrogenase family)
VPEPSHTAYPTSTPILAGKVGLVTGAAAGIGRAVAHAFARHGATVVVTDLDGPGARRVAQEITGLGGHAAAHQLDVTDPGAHATVVDFVRGSFGGVNAACHNAGITIDPTPTAELSWSRGRACGGSIWTACSMGCARSCR